MESAHSEIYYLRQLHMAVQKLLEGNLRSRKLVSKTVPTSALIVLLLAAERGRISSAALARLQGISPQAVNRNVTSLVQSGLIERLESDESQRILLIRLTEEGEVVRQSVLAAFSEVDRLIFRGVSAAERTTLEKILRKALGNVRPFAMLESAGAP